MKNKMTQEMMLSRLFRKTLMLLKITSSRRRSKVAELREFPSRVAKNHFQFNHGKRLMLIPFQTTWIGETSTEPTSSHGARISTFHNTADLAGLRAPHQLLLIDSTSC
jgi:hypothetical protein